MAFVTEYVWILLRSRLKTQRQIWKLGKTILERFNHLQENFKWAFLPRSWHSGGTGNTSYKTPGEAQMKPAPQRLQDHTCFQREQCYIFVLPKVLQCPFVLLGLQRRLHCQNGQCPGRTFSESPRRESDENNFHSSSSSHTEPSCCSPARIPERGST